MRQSHLNLFLKLYEKARSLGKERPYLIAVEAMRLVLESKLSEDEAIQRASGSVPSSKRSPTSRELLSYYLQLPIHTRVIASMILNSDLDIVLRLIETGYPLKWVSEALRFVYTAIGSNSEKVSEELLFQALDPNEFKVALLMGDCYERYVEVIGRGTERRELTHEEWERLTESVVRFLRSLPPERLARVLLVLAERSA